MVSIQKHILDYTLETILKLMLDILLVILKVSLMMVLLVYLDYHLRNLIFTLDLLLLKISLKEETLVIH